MKKKLCFFIMIMMFYLFSINTFSEINKQKSNLGFTTAELKYIKNNPIVKVGNDIEYPPFDFLLDGKPQGYSLELLELILKDSGLKIEYISDNWENLLTKQNKNEVNILTTVTFTDEDCKNMLYSDPYAELLEVVIVNKNSKINNINDLNGKKIAIPAEYEYIDDLKFLNINFEHVIAKNMSDAVKLLSLGKADAVIESLAVINYEKNKLGISNLKIAFEYKIDGIENSIRYSINKENKILQGIINKLQKKISAEQKIALSEKWFGFKTSRIKTKKIIAAFRERPPHTFFKNNKPSGPMIDIIEKAFREIDYEVEWQFNIFENSLQEINVGKIDIIPRLFYNKKREETIKFLGPIKNDIKTSRFLVQNGMRNKINTFEDLKKLKIGILSDTIYFDKFDNNNEISKVIKSDIIDLLNLFKNNKIDAIAFFDNINLENTLINLNIKNYEYAKYKFEEEVSIFYGFSKFSPNINLYNQINDTLKKMRESGEIEYIYESYNANKINLTKEEKKYLSQKKKLTLCIQENNLPIEGFNSKGEYDGISSEFIKKIGLKLGIPIEIKISKLKENRLENFKNNNYDIISAISENKDLEKDLDFSFPYIYYPLVIATKSNELYIDNLMNISNKKIGIIKNLEYLDFIRENYPKLQIIEVDNVKKGLEMVSNKELYAYIDSVANIGYTIQNENIADLKISGTINSNLELRMAVMKNNILLLNILNKAINSFSEEETHKILNKWLSVKYYYGFDYKLFWKILGGIILIVLIIIFRNFQLNLFNEKLSKLNKEILIKSNSIKNLFDNAGQGFLSFDDSLNIDSEYSIEAKKIFNKELSGLSFVKLAYNNSNEKDTYEKILNNIFNCFNLSDFQKVDLYISLLPNELIINNKNIKFEYKIIKIENRYKLMSILTDVTEKRKLEKHLKIEAEISQMIVKVLTNRNDVIYFINQYNDFCENKIYKILSDFSTCKEILYKIFFDIHTFKGNFYQVKMKKTGDNLDKFEATIKTLLKNESDLKNKNIIDIFNIMKIKDYTNDDLKIINSILGFDFLKTQNRVNIPVYKLIAIEKIVSKSFQSKEKINLLRKIRELWYKSFKEILLSYKEFSIELAIEKNKSIDSFLVIGDDIKIKPEKYNSFKNSLIHIFRNIIAHGIENQELRIKKGKSSGGNIVCVVNIKKQKVIISISDDGYGIDLIKIKEKLIQKGTSETEILKMTKEEILNSIFSEEFSTSDSFTNLYGKGVGLSSTKCEIEILGGNIKVKTNKNKGTTFIIEIPLIDDINSL